MNPEFLDVDDVIELHAMQLAEFGGLPGLRDRGLLESALAQAQATAFGEFLHADVVTMAAAYLFHIVRNHPFADGNKRAGLLAALVFLDINGMQVPDGEPSLYELTLGVAEGSIDKAAVADALRHLTTRGDG
ncbi:MAG: type II toxin-antitoxin system death-on-curing family toxin [Polyangiales bacterium]